MVSQPKHTKEQQSPNQHLYKSSIKQHVLPTVDPVERRIYKETQQTVDERHSLFDVGM